MKVIAVLLRLVPLAIVAVLLVYVFDVRGARQPMSDAYIGLVERVIAPVVEDFQTEFAPDPTPVGE